MDKFIGQFSLQNILRQMFCGVVFLLPFFLFHSIVVLEGQAIEIDFRNVCTTLHELNLSGWEMTCLSILAIIIGTLIYHLEKNIWSYGLQILFTSRIGKGRLWVLGALVSALGLPFLVPHECKFDLPNILTYNNFSSFVLIIAFFIMFFSLSVSLLCILYSALTETHKMWIAEGGGSDTKNNSDTKKIIMDKVSTWSDFVHCGQSCAWAWILGSMSAYVLFKNNDILTPFYRNGIWVAWWLLIAEAFIDRHRWQHVKRVLGEKDTAKESTINSALSSCMPNACKRCIRSSKTGRCILWRIVVCRIKKRFNKIREWFSRGSGGNGKTENSSNSKKDSKK